METTSYKRKPLVVEAVQVTVDNLYDVAKWCGGDVRTMNSTKEKYIQIRVLHPNKPEHSMAFSGDWVLKSEQGYKIYKDSAFQSGFEPVTTEETKLEEANDALQLAFKG
jgi:hypothetical protein